MATCIRRHLDGDPEAMTDLTRQVRPWLYRIARSYRISHEMADDVVQSTLLAALLHVHRLRDPESSLFLALGGMSPVGSTPCDQP